MTNVTDFQDLDKIFESLANEHRRKIIYSLGLQPYSVNQLASQIGLTLPAIHKHIKILKSANLIIEKKIGRTHFLAIKRHSLQILQKWLVQYHTYWGHDDESLENYVRHLTEKTLAKGGE